MNVNFNSKWPSAGHFLDNNCHPFGSFFCSDHNYKHPIKIRTISLPQEHRVQAGKVLFIRHLSGFRMQNDKLVCWQSVVASQQVLNHHTFSYTKRQCFRLPFTLTCRTNTSHSWSLLRLWKLHGSVSQLSSQQTT